MSGSEAGLNRGRTLAAKRATRVADASASGSEGESEEEEEEEEQGGSGDEAYLAVQVGEEARDGALMSESDVDSAQSDGEGDGAVESDSGDEGADVTAFCAEEH